MEGANLALSNNLTLVIAVLGLVIIILAGLLFSVKGKLNALQAKYDYFTQGKEANIDVVLTDTLTELHKTQAELAVLQEKPSMCRITTGRKEDVIKDRSVHHRDRQIIVRVRSVHRHRKDVNRLIRHLHLI